MAGKRYASPDVYERKLARVMERLVAEEFNWNWERKVIVRVEVA